MYSTSQNPYAQGPSNDYRPHLPQSSPRDPSLAHLAHANTSSQQPHPSCPTSFPMSAAPPNDEQFYSYPPHPHPPHHADHSSHHHLPTGAGGSGTSAQHVDAPYSRFSDDAHSYQPSSSSVDYASASQAADHHPHAWNTFMPPIQGDGYGRDSGLPSQSLLSPHPPLPGVLSDMPSNNKADMYGQYGDGHDKGMYGVPSNIGTNGSRRAYETSNVKEENKTWSTQSSTGFAPEVDVDIRMLHESLSEIIYLLHPLAQSSPHAKTQTTPYLRERMTNLASQIQTHLLSLQPNVSPFLSLSFAPPPSSLRANIAHLPGMATYSPEASAMSRAEKDMEIIRKRRDALNAKAAQSAAFNYSALVLAASSSASPPSGVPRRDEFSSASLGGMGMPPPRDTSFRVPTQHVPPPMHSRERTECAGCGTKVTAEWRRGPDGPRSLCNSCGLHYAKILKRRTNDQHTGDGAVDTGQNTYSISMPSVSGIDLGFASNGSLPPHGF